MLSLAVLALLSPLALAVRTTVTSSGNYPGVTYITFPNTKINQDANAGGNQFVTATGISNCASQAADAGFQGFEYSTQMAFTKPGGGNVNCYFFMFSSPCARQSMISFNEQFTTGYVDRCSMPQAPAGYSMAADGTCIYTQNMPPTMADYNGACSNNAVVPMPSQAYKKRNAAPQPALGLGPAPQLFIEPSLCTKGLTACPISSGFECLDTQSNIESCGGCVSALGQGEDCTAAPGVSSTSCIQGTCRIDSCARGFRLTNGVCKNILRSSVKQ